MQGQQSGLQHQDPYNQSGLQHPASMPQGQTGVPPGGEGLKKQGGFNEGKNEGFVGGTTALPQQQQTTNETHYQAQGGMGPQHLGKHAEPLKPINNEPGAVGGGVGGTGLHHHHDAPVTGYVAEPKSASDKGKKKLAKDQESEAHRMSQLAAQESKEQNKTLMNDPNASVGTKISAAGHAFKDWATEKKHGMQADHHDKKVEEKELKHEREQRELLHERGQLADQSGIGHQQHYGGTTGLQDQGAVGQQRYAAGQQEQVGGVGQQHRYGGVGQQEQGSIGQQQHYGIGQQQVPPQQQQTKPNYGI